MFESWTKEQIEKVTYYEMIEYVKSIGNYFLTYNVAKCPGFEAHHVIPVYVQNTTREIADLTPCVRCTAYDHVLLHWKAALEFGGRWITAFAGVSNYQFCHLPEIQQMNLSQLKKFAELRTMDDETKDTLREKSANNQAALGYHHSEEVKETLRQKMKGNNYSKGKRVYQINRETGEIIREFKSMAEASRETGIPRVRIEYRCHDKYSDTGIYTFRFVN